MIGKLQRLFITPRSEDKDSARREFILNILLVGSITLTFVSLIYNVVEYTKNILQQNTLTPPFLTLAFLLFFCLLLFLSRKGFSRFVSFIFIAISFAIPTFTTITWGSDVPQSWIAFSLVIVMSGILIGTRFSLIMTVLIGITQIAISYNQIHFPYSFMSDWKKEPFTLSDTLLRVVTLGLITLISWLFNRESESALKRARSSEEALRKERDLLEIKVVERTTELRRAEAEKLVQFYKLVEYGRMTSGIFHDLVNPLSLVSLTLDRLESRSSQSDTTQLQEIQQLVQRAQQGTRRLESFVQVARQQMQRQENLELFSADDEIKQALVFLNHKILKHDVVIQLHLPDHIDLHGNKIKFHQAISNLISNAIDAYEGTRGVGKIVSVSATSTSEEILIEVQDWGMGISEENMCHIFEPFFTTKEVKSGIGIGLSICKDIIEKDFNGRLFVKSMVNKGSTFTVTLPVFQAII